MHVPPHDIPTIIRGLMATTIHNQNIATAGNKTERQSNCALCIAGYEAVN
jgi:hypothetical protein